MAKPKPVKPTPKKMTPAKKPKIEDDSFVASSTEKAERKSAKKKDKKLRNETKAFPSGNEMVNSSVESVARTQVEAGVQAMRQLSSKAVGKGKSELFESEGNRLRLQVSGIKLPRDSDSVIIKTRVPHSPLPTEPDICLFVKDLEKGIKVDHEPTVNHFKDLLADKGVTGITEVISLRELKVEYKQFEAKTALCHRFDLFLADDRIMKFLPSLLGKAFYSRRKLPVQVNLRAPNLKSEALRAMSTVTLPMSNKGNCSAVTVGYSTLTDAQIADNVSAVVNSLQKKYPGGWNNIRSIYLKSEVCTAVPLYVTLRSNEGIGKVVSGKAAQKRKEYVTDELSTIPGATVTVTPFGTVRVKRVHDPDWEQINNDQEDGDNDDEEGLEGRDGEESESEGEKENKKQKEKPARKRKMAAKEESESEDGMEDQELEYMKKMAEEEAAMERQLEKNEEALNSNKINDSEEDGDDGEDGEEESGDEAADDDAEAENLLDDDEDEEGADESKQDSDDDLYMRNQPQFYSEPESEDEQQQKPAKKKKGKKKKEVSKKSKKAEQKDKMSKKKSEKGTKTPKPKEAKKNSKTKKK